MPNTLVNIITEDNPLPAYLFVREKYQPGDRLMLISAKDTEDDLDELSEVIGVPESNIDEIVLKNDIDEFRYELICRRLKNAISPDVKYLVNLAGGTRYLALAVQQVFEDADSEFYYLNTEDNQLIKSKFDDDIYNGDDITYAVKHKMSVLEYLNIHNMKHDMAKGQHAPIRPFEQAQRMFKLFVEKKFSDEDFYAFETIRTEYRNRRKLSISDIVNGSAKCPKTIPQFAEFIQKTGFTLNSQEVIYRDELEWLTGGWFEEYVYYIVKEAIAPDDIAIGVHVGTEGVELSNELDVVFVLNNEFFVIECKTGIASDSLFNAIVYKACALKETLLGISCNSFIFTLKEDNEKDKLARIAANMDIRLVDRDIITDEKQLRKEWYHMQDLANVAYAKRIAIDND